MVFAKRHVPKVKRKTRIKSEDGFCESQKRSCVVSLFCSKVLGIYRTHKDKFPSIRPFAPKIFSMQDPR